MSRDLLFALTAGTLASLNPCGFAMLPAYLTLFVTGTPAGGGPPDRMAALGRAGVATAAMTGGFVAVFAIFGLLLTPVTSSVQRWLPAVTIVIGAGLVLLGALLLIGRDLVLCTPKLRGRNPVSNPRSMVLYGVSYAIASLGCTIGPFLVLTSTTFRAGDLLTGVLAYAAYAVGMGLVVGGLAVSAALAQPAAVRILRGLLPYVTRIGGLLLVMVGAYVAWYGLYELRVFAGGNADDPVITAASSIQSALAGWVENLGPITFALALFAMAALVAAGTMLNRRRAPALSPAADAIGAERGEVAGDPEARSARPRR